MEYCCDLYVKELKIHNIMIIMTEAKEKIAAFIDFYNDRRSHMSLRMQTPSAIHAGQNGEQKSCWVFYREKLADALVPASAMDFLSVASGTKSIRNYETSFSPPRITEWNFSYFCIVYYLR